MVSIHEECLLILQSKVAERDDLKEAVSVHDID